MTRNVEGDGPPGTSAPGLPARDGYGRGVSPFRPDSRRPALYRLIPVSEQLPGYRGGTLRRDLHQRLREAGVLDLVGEGHSYPTVRAAVAAARAREEQS
jgi:hypothetical protein